MAMATTTTARTKTRKQNKKNEKNKQNLGCEMARGHRARFLTLSLSCFFFVCHTGQTFHTAPQIIYI